MHEPVFDGSQVQTSTSHLEHWYSPGLPSSRETETTGESPAKDHENDEKSEAFL